MNATARDLIDPTDLNCALDNAVGTVMREHVSASEWERRLDAAAYAAHAILTGTHAV
ncbi:hypothetical protein [Gordonia sihwensis]|uniref:hypothetical protein n=1 Tax=Gordonia sihwensis TaxID=173559 RepID=UPI003D99425C